MKLKKGFAAMDPAKLRAIAGKGGKAAHKKGTAHEWNTTTAKLAGFKGGTTTWARRRQATKPTEA